MRQISSFLGNHPSDMSTVGRTRVRSRSPSYKDETDNIGQSDISKNKNGNNEIEIIDDINVNGVINDSNIEFSSEQLKLIAIISKFSILVILTLIGTFLTCISVALLGIYGISYFVGSINVLCMALDMFINVLCLLLQWPFSNDWYQMACKTCNNCMILKCTNNFEQYLKQKQRFSVN